MMRFLKSCLLCFFTGSVLAGYGQDDIANNIKQQFDAYQHNTLQEKIYVHSDKSTYLAGDIIWFKVYYVNAADHTPLHLSKVAYVEVLNGANQAIVQAKIDLKEGSGSAFVPLNSATGQYTFRAYTAWMKNVGQEQFFQKPITIINTLKNFEPLTDTSSDYSIQVFPEGGNLVSGLQSNVAVNVTGRNGNGVDFSGSLLTENGDTVTTITSFKFGIGTFLFTPSSNHTYRVAVTLPTGRSLKKELPQVYAQGYVMQLKNAANGRLSVLVTSSGRTDKTLFLIAHNRQQVQWAEGKPTVNGQAQFLLDTATLPEGITHFTVFNEEQNPVCERLYFKKPVPKILLDVHSDQPQYAPRKKVEVIVQSAGADSTPLNLSVAVYKLDSLQAENSVNIVNYLTLTSELSGTVEAPDFYFSGDAQAGEAADNLMLTHGWRRYRWETILLNEKVAPRFPLEYNGHLVKALVTDTRTGQPAPDIYTFLSIPGNAFQFYVAKSDSAGMAQFDVKNYYGPGDVIFQTNTTYDSVYRVQSISPFAAQAASYAAPHFYFSKQNSTALLGQSISMQVQNIYRKDSLMNFRLPAAFDTVPFYGRSDYSYPLDVYTRFPTMEEVLREYVRPINVVQRHGGLHMLILDDAHRTFFENDELVLLDGIPIFNKDKMFSYDPLKVKKLDVITKRYFIGPVFFNGIASFTTYNGAYDGFQLDPRSIVIDYEGLQLERAFFAPVYETPQQQASRLPDFRNTLFWKPHVATAAGKTAFSFYTSDQKGTYMVVTEGMDDKGNAVVAHLPFEVK